jgi:ubiquinone/menaquinone biosynthesis C-methylase UbiE
MSNRRWRGWENAEIYDRFVREHRIYTWLNERLVERAGLEKARRVLDLGCGTGATTQACLRRLGSMAEVVGLDGSDEMVALARTQTMDPRARFVVSDAAAVHEAVSGTFDRAVSNAAFWQFPRMDRVLASLAQVLEPGALLVFNVPAERIEGRSQPFHPFQLALARTIEEHTGEPFASTSTSFDPGQLREFAEAQGFHVQQEDRVTYEGLQEEFMELMSIPAMINPLTPDLGDEETQQVLEEARAATEPKERVKVVWTYFTLRFRD